MDRITLAGVPNFQTFTGKAIFIDFKRVNQLWKWKFECGCSYTQVHARQKGNGVNVTIKWLDSSSKSDLRSILLTENSGKLKFKVQTENRNTQLWAVKTCVFTHISQKLFTRFSFTCVSSYQQASFLHEFCDQTLWNWHPAKSKQTVNRTPFPWIVRVSQ